MKTGEKMSEAQKQKISKSNIGKNKGRKLTDEHKKKLRKVNMGNTYSKNIVCGEKTRKKRSDATKGKNNPNYSGDSNRGKKLSDTGKKKVSDANKGNKYKLGKKHTDEARRKLSATKQGIPYDEWEAFAREAKYCPKFNETCRESCREKYGRRCFICNKTEKANGQKLSVHHVDMDKAQGCESNWKLVPLCKRHHATAHNDEMMARLGYLIKDVK